MKENNRQSSIVNDPLCIGVFGGSFDPVHCGHITVAQDAVEQLGLDRLIFMPAAMSPHKPDRTLAGDEHRFAMLELAAGGNPVFEVSGLELRRGGVSYTFDTITQLRTENSAAQFFFIIGLDSLAELHRWYRIEELLKICTIVPFARGGDNAAEIAAQIQLTGEWKQRLLGRVIAIHKIDVSSSDIRHRLAAGKNIRGLVPAAVERYIDTHHLYREKGKNLMSEALPEVIGKSIKFLDEKNAKDIVILDLRAVANIADYFVVASAANKPHLKALSDGLQRLFKNEQYEGWRAAGTPESGWAIVDYDGVMIHIFSDEMRSFYDLEKLWKDAVRVEPGNVE